MTHRGSRPSRSRPLESALQRGRRHVPGLRIAIDEHGPRTAVQDGVAAAHEGQRRAEHGIARLHAQKQKRQVDRGRARTHGRPVAHADMGRQFLFEPIHVRAQRRDPVGLEGILDECGFLVAQVRGREPDALRELAARDDIHRQALIVHDRNMGDAVLAQEMLDLCRGRGLAHHQRRLTRQLTQRASAGGLLQQGAPEVAVGDRARKPARQVDSQQYPLGGLVHACRCFDPGQ